MCQPPSAKRKHDLFGVLTEDQFRQSNPVIVRNYRNSMGPGTLSDRAMGASRDEPCTTCHKTIADCGGHLGAIELPADAPVVMPTFHKLVVSILNAACDGCGRLMYVPTARDAEMSEEPEQARNAICRSILQAASAAKKCPYCAWVREKGSGYGRKYDAGSITALEVEARLNLITEADNARLRLNGIRHVREFVTRLFPVLAESARPTSGDGSKDDATILYEELLRAVAAYNAGSAPPVDELGESDGEVDEDDAALSEEDVHGGDGGGRPAKARRTIASTEAAKRIETAAWEIINGNNGKTSRRPLLGIAQRVGGKKGRLRNTMQAVRILGYLRTVIVPRADLPIGWLFVPRAARQFLTSINAVTDLTLPEIMERTRAAIAEGHNVYCVRSDGRPFMFSGKSAIRLHVGDAVHLPAREGDYVLFNRQPTLSDASMMAHRIKFWDNLAIGMSFVECLPYAADFDGDEMNIYRLPTKRAQAEAMCMTNAVFYATHMKLAQEAAYSTHKLSYRSTFFDKDEFQEILGVLPAYMRYPLPEPVCGGPAALWSGRHVLEMILAHTHLTLITGKPSPRFAEFDRAPPTIEVFKSVMHPRVYASFVTGFAATAGDPAATQALAAQFWAHVADIEAYGPEGEPGGPDPASLNYPYFVVRDHGLRGSRFEAGRLPGDLVQRIVKDINNTLPIASSRVSTAGFLDALVAVTCPHMRRHSITASFKSFTPLPDVAAFTAKRVALGVDQFAALVEWMSTRPAPLGYAHARTLASMLSVCMDDARAEITPTLVASMLGTGNHILKLALAAAKGTNSAFVDVCGFVGQQNFGTTPGLAVLRDEGRPFAWASRDSNELEARGVVLRNLTDGLLPVDMKNMGAAAAMNLALKATQPRGVGYMTRQLATHMVDFATTNWQAVRDATGTILTLRFGVGISVSWMRRVAFDVADFAGLPEASDVAALFNEWGFWKGGGQPKTFSSPVDMHAHITSCVEERKSDEEEDTMPGEQQAHLIDEFMSSVDIAQWSVLMRAYVRSQLLRVPLGPSLFRFITSSLLVKMECAKVPSAEAVGLKASQDLTQRKIQGALKLQHSAGKATESTGKFEAIMANSNRCAGMVVALADPYNKEKAALVAASLERLTMADCLHLIEFYVSGVDADDDDWIRAELLEMELRGDVNGTRLTDGWTSRDGADVLIIRLVIGAFTRRRHLIRSEDLAGCLAKLCAHPTWVGGIMDVLPFFVVNDATRLSEDLVGYIFVPLARDGGRVQLPVLKEAIVNTKKLIRGHRDIESVRISKRWDGQYVVMTEGSALAFLTTLPGVDMSRSYSTLPSDTESIFGIVGARTTLINELAGVCDAAPEHITLVGDYLTMRGKVDGFGWQSLQANTSEPWRTAIFERPLTVFPNAAVHGLSDSNTAATTRMVKGDTPYIGTGLLQVGADFYARGADGKGLCTLPDNAFVSSVGGRGGGGGGGGGGGPVGIPPERPRTPEFAPNSPAYRPGTPPGSPDSVPLEADDGPQDAWNNMTDAERAGAQVLTADMENMDI